MPDSTWVQIAPQYGVTALQTTYSGLGEMDVTTTWAGDYSASYEHRHDERFDPGIGHRLEHWP
jgi:hypothetical protein